MRNTKEIREEMAEVTKELDIFLADENVEDFTDEGHEALEVKFNGLEKELERTEAQEGRLAKIAASTAGQGASKGEEKETVKLIGKVSFAKAAAAKLFDGKELDGVEAEMNQIAQKEKEDAGLLNHKTYRDAERMVSIPGSWIKFGNMLPDGNGGHTRATVTVSGEGTDTVQTNIQSIIPALNIDPVLARAGASSLTGLVGDQQWPLGSTLTMAWETETSAEADATASFTKASISPKRLGGKIPVSWKFMKQVPAANAFFQNQLERHINIALDAASFHGATDGPTGIESTTGVTNDSANDEAVLTWKTTVSLKAAVKTGNGDVMGSAYFLPADVWEQGMTTGRNTGTSADNMIINEGSQTMAGSRFFVSESITNDNTTDSDEAYMFYGDPSQNIFGYWGGVDLLVDPYTLAASAGTIIHSNLYCDHVLLLGGSWAFTNKILIV